MRGNCARRHPGISLKQCLGDASEDRVLLLRIRRLVVPLQLDPDRKVVTTAAVPKNRFTGMPGTSCKRHELNKLAIPSYQQVCGDFEPTNLIEIRVRVPIEAVAEQLLYLRPAELTGRQADTVHDDQVRRDTSRSGILIGARTLPGPLNKPVVGIDAIRCSHRWLPLSSGTTIVRVTDANCQRQPRHPSVTMSVTRLFVNTELQTGGQIRLDAEQTRYIGRALRLRVGSSLSVFNGRGGEFSATVGTIGRNSALLLIGERSEAVTESPLKVHLVQGISRGERMDFVVQKATELGVKRISPVLTEHGVVKLDAMRAARRRDHWQGVAASACEQSGRTRPPLIDPPMALNAWFGSKSNAADTDLILRPGADTPLAAIAAPATKVCLLIGPEGGFSESEYEDAQLAGFTAVSLGPRILRTETAALTALAVVQSAWGDLGGSIY